MEHPNPSMMWFLFQIHAIVFSCFKGLEKALNAFKSMLLCYLIKIFFNLNALVELLAFFKFVNCVSPESLMAFRERTLC